MRKERAPISGLCDSCRVSVYRAIVGDAFCQNGQPGYYGFSILSICSSRGAGSFCLTARLPRFFVEQEVAPYPGHLRAFNLGGGAQAAFTPVSGCHHTSL